MNEPEGHRGLHGERDERDSYCRRIDVSVAMDEKHPGAYFAKDGAGHAAEHAASKAGPAQDTYSGRERDVVGDWNLVPHDQKDQNRRRDPERQRIGRGGHATARGQIGGRQPDRQPDRQDVAEVLLPRQPRRGVVRPESPSRSASFGRPRHLRRHAHPWERGDGAPSAGSPCTAP